MKELSQIEEEVSFMRDYVSKSTDPDHVYTSVTGYLLCGKMVDNYRVRGKASNLAKADIYIRLYSDLLSMAQQVHKEFINRYNELKKAKVDAAG